MRNISAIFLREFRSYFLSPIAYIVTAIFLIITGYFFYTYLSGFLQYAIITSLQATEMRAIPPAINVNQLVIEPLFHNFSTVALFMVPMITMRLLAEEKKTMSIELLLTSPVTTLQIVLGKFFAGVALLVAMVAPTILYFVVLVNFGEPEIAPIIAGYIGFFLLGTGFVSIGLLISSMTENQIIAGAVSFGIFLLLWVIGWVANYVERSIGEILSYMSLINHYDDFTKGIIDTENILFYLSFIGFGLYLTYRAVESIRWRG
ncbi:ABC transporter permease [candidate division KSB1 bacterium]